MSVSIKDLRYRTKQVLMSLKRGEQPIITFRGSPIARLMPLSSAEKKTFREIGFGMWKDHGDMEDVTQWLDAQRKPRFNR